MGRSSGGGGRVSATRSGDFLAARAQFRAAITRARVSGSPIAVRDAARAQQAMQQAAGRSISMDRAYELALFQIGRR